LVTLASAALVAALGQPAHAGVVSCSFDAPSATVTIAPPIPETSITVANGDEIWADGAPCGAATTTTTDTIVVDASSDPTVEIDLGGGPFAPGKTAEASGTSEIEFQVSGGSIYLTIAGSSGPDHITGRAIGPFTTDQSGINLNADESPADDDLVLHRTDLLAHTRVDLGGGADSYSGAQPGDDPWDALANDVFVTGGAGADTIVPGLGEGKYWGDGLYTTIDDKRDTLSIAWLPAACTAVVRNQVLGEGTWFDCDNTITLFETALFERVIGHEGDGFIFGGAKGEELDGRGGDDTIVPSFGTDTVSGGTGWDALTYEGNNAAHVDLTARRVTGYGLDHYRGFEGIFSDSDEDDVFAGDPPPQIESLGGAGGHNLLDLRTASRRWTVYLTTSPQLGQLTPVLFATHLNVIGTPFGDRIVGGPGPYPDGPEEIRGYGGNDRLDGGPGDDIVHGGPGDDVVDGGAGTDICTGGPGYDIVSGCEN